MTVAIAILNWNGKNWLEKFLPSVISHSIEAEIFVIDNASTDDSVQFLKSNFPSVKIIQNNSNSGFAKGYNDGLKSIKADIFCLLNSDVEVTENWISPITKLFSEDQNIAAIQPKILDYNQKDKFEFAGAGGGLIDNLGYPYCRGRIFDDIEFDKGQYDDETEIFWASGCSLFIRSDDFWKMNGFLNNKFPFWIFFNTFVMTWCKEHHRNIKVIEKQSFQLKFCYLFQFSFYSDRDLVMVEIHGNKRSIDAIDRKM